MYSASQEDQKKKPEKKLGDMLLHGHKYLVSYHWYDTQH